MTTPTGTAPPPPAPAPQASTEGAGTGTKPPAGTGAPPPAPPAGAPPPAPPPAKPGEAPPPPPTTEKPPGTEVVYDLKLPDGSPLKPTDVDAVKAWAKEQGLSVKQAQAQLDRESKAQVDRVAAEKADLAAKSQAWKKVTLEHPELGGQNLPRTTKRCSAALERFDTDGSLKQILETSGIGDLPAVVAYQERIGAALEDSRFIAPPPVPRTEAPKTNADVFYGGEKK